MHNKPNPRIAERVGEQEGMGTVAKRALATGGKIGGLSLGEAPSHPTTGTVNYTDLTASQSLPVVVLS